LAKYWEGPSRSIWGRTPRAATGRVGLGTAGDWIGFRVRFFLEWDMTTVGYEKAEFLQICKWILKDQYKKIFVSFIVLFGNFRSLW